MWGHSLLSGFAGMVLSLIAPLANTALVAPTTGTADCGLTVSQSGVTAGTTVQLTWWTVNAQNGGVTMSDNGSTPVTVNPSGSIPLTVNANHSFALTVRNTYGSKTCTASITSSTQTNNGPTCAISVPPGTYYAGQAVPLIWYSHNATSGQVGGIGAVSGSRLESGSGTIYPQQSTTVSMQVRNNYGSNTCSTPVTITPRPTTTAQQPIYTTSYRPVTTTSYAPSYQPLSYRPTTSGIPSYSTPSYSNSRYPSPLYSSGWYPDTRLGSPSYSNGLGDWTLTNQFLDVGSGRYMYTDHDCTGVWCDNTASSWGSVSANGTTMYGGSEYYNGENYGWSETYDRYGNMIGRAETPSQEEFDAAMKDPRYTWTTDSVLPGAYDQDARAGVRMNTGETTGGLTTLDDQYTGGYGMYNTQGDAVSTSGYQWGANPIPAGDGMTPDPNAMYYYYGTPDYNSNATVQNSAPAAAIGETDWSAADWSSGWNMGAQEPVINTQWDSSSQDGNWI